MHGHVSRFILDENFYDRCQTAGEAVTGLEDRERALAKTRKNKEFERFFIDLDDIKPTEVDDLHDPKANEFKMCVRRAQQISYNQNMKCWTAKDEVCICGSCLNGQFDECEKETAPYTFDDCKRKTLASTEELIPMEDESSSHSCPIDSPKAIDIIEHNSPTVPLPNDSDVSDAQFQLCMSPQSKMTVLNSHYFQTMNNDAFYTSDIMDNYIRLLKVIKNKIEFKLILYLFRKKPLIMISRFAIHELRN